jgi:acetyl esterase/lipase
MRPKTGMIDPDLRARGQLMRIVNGTFTERRLRLIHRLMKRRRTAIKDDVLQIRQEWVWRNDGSRLRLLVFGPRMPRDNVPGVLWLHGGGYAIGAPEQALPMARRLIAASGCVVIAPDYRMSIEAPYPAALEDSYAALLWMKDHARDLGIRDDQLMVGGDSAGGGLAVAVAMCARDKGQVAIAFQMPLYPMLDDRMTSASARDNDAPVWNSRSNAIAWRLYLGPLFGADDVPVYAAPARATDYSRLPPAVTFVGALEPFRDETLQYVDNLKTAGVAVDCLLLDGCYHGFDQVCPDADVSRRAIDFVLDRFSHAVGNHFAEQTVAEP